MKLELKHIAPYLPYELEIKYRASSTQFLGKDNLHLIDLCLNKQWKPILRPLSDLTKEIEHNGEILTPSEKYWGLTSFSVFFNYDGWVNLESYLNSKVPYGVVQCLIKWHFDVFGLIEKGLAIDINTI